MSEISTRVGLIDTHDNRFLGRSVFSELRAEVRDLDDALSVVFRGEPLDETARLAVRFIVLGLTSPDARIWPLKLCRLLSSHGSEVVGFFGAQVIMTGRTMGPGIATPCAKGLVFVAERAGDDATDEQLLSAFDAFCAQNDGRFMGFGVPFREKDERLLAMRGWVEDSKLASGRFWRLAERLSAALDRRSPLEPNIALGLTALLLDINVPPERCGLAATLLISHVFAAHALEASQTDGDLRSLPVRCIDYRGPAPRRIS